MLWLTALNHKPQPNTLTSLHLKKAKHNILIPVIAKGTSAGWLSSEGEDIPKAAKRFRKQAGGVPLQ
jgi:hypothetical protein